MKKIRLLSLSMVFMISLFTSHLNGQSAFVNLNIGYAGKLSSSNLEYFQFYNYTTDNNSSTYEQVKVSLGKGFNIGGTFGYMFNENIGADLGLTFLIGGKSKAKDEYVGGTTDYTLSAKMVRINPSLIIASGLKGINPYAKFGLIIGSGSIEFLFEDHDGGAELNVRTKLNGGLAVGFTAGVGILYELADNMSFFGEISMINMSYSPTKGEIIEASYNGRDVLSDLTTNDKEVEFVNSYTINYLNPPPDSEPDKDLKQQMPFSSLGINLGIRVSF